MRRARKTSEVRPVARRGFAVKPGSNPIAYGLGVYATPRFAARVADPDWLIVDLATGETVGRAGDFA